MKTRVGLKYFVNDCRLLENLLTGKGLIRAGGGTFRVGKGAIRAGQDF